MKSSAIHFDLHLSLGKSTTIFNDIAEIKQYNQLSSALSGQLLCFYDHLTTPRRSNDVITAICKLGFGWRNWKVNVYEWDVLAMDHTVTLLNIRSISTQAFLSKQVNDGQTSRNPNRQIIFETVFWGGSIIFRSARFMVKATCEYLFLYNRQLDP